MTIITYPVNTQSNGTAVAVLLELERTPEAVAVSRIDGRGDALPMARPTLHSLPFRYCYKDCIARTFLGLIHSQSDNRTMVL